MNHLYINDKKVHVGDWITNGTDIWLRTSSRIPLAPEAGKSFWQYVNIHNGDFERPFGELRFADRDDLM